MTLIEIQKYIYYSLPTEHLSSALATLRVHTSLQLDENHRTRGLPCNKVFNVSYNSLNMGWGWKERSSMDVLLHHHEDGNS